MHTRVAGEPSPIFFPETAAAFYERIPFRYHDRALIESDLRAAGFDKVQIDTIELRSRAARPATRHGLTGNADAFGN